MKYKRNIFLPLILLLLVFQFDVSAKTVCGVVIDVNSNEPLKGVTVMVLDTANVIHTMQNTDSTGAFTIKNVKLDRFKVRTYRYGYVSTVTGPYDITTHNNLDMLIRVESVPLTMKEVSVSAKEINPYLENVHFYDRKEMGTGYYRTWKDFKDRGLNNVYNIFTGIPGLTVTRSGVYFTRYESQQGPLIYVDGLYISPQAQGPGVGAIGWLNPEDVLAVEVYNAINAPIEYSQGAHKGVILVWTK